MYASLVYSAVWLLEKTRPPTNMSLSFCFSMLALSLIVHPVSLSMRPFFHFQIHVDVSLHAL